VSNDKDGLREPFLNRWARQKQAQQTPPAKRPQTSEVNKPEPEIDQAELIAKLPKLEDLTAQSDITGFLQKGVPDALRNLALRQMWSLDPTIRDFVEVAENQWDFNTPGGIHGLFQEVAEGTDISVWMAQATQSVIGEPEAKKVAAEADAAADAVPIERATREKATALPSADHGTVQDVSNTAMSDGVAHHTVVDHATHNSLAAAESEAAAQPEHESAKPLQRPLTRRRHGGALPPERLS
jgi:hypothetical protein